MKILIGSCGGLTGVYLTKRYKNNFYMHLDVYGFDSSVDNAAKFFLDKFFVAPKLNNEEAFLNFLINTINENNIDFYIPTYSKEVEVIARNETLIKNKTKIRFIVSEVSTIQALEDKKNAYDNLREIGINVPQIYGEEGEFKFPLFSKPRIGSGSKRNTIIYNWEQMKLLKELEDDLIFTELLQGKEYTVDAIFDGGGALVAYNQRTRDKTLGGAVIVSSNNFDVDCKEYLIKISQKFKIKGVCNFQFFLTKKGLYFTDINLRFASGGLPLSVESGVNIPEILVKILNNEEVKGKYCSDKKQRTMYRYFEEIFEYEG